MRLVPVLNFLSVVFLVQKGLSGTAETGRMELQCSYIPHVGSDASREEIHSYCMRKAGVEKLTRSSLKGDKNRALFPYKNGRLSGIGLLEASKKANLAFKSPSAKPLLNSGRA